VGVNGTVRLRLPRAHYLFSGEVTNGDGSVDTLAAPWHHHVQDSELAKVETSLLAQGPTKAAGGPSASQSRSSSGNSVEETIIHAYRLR
jgi:hypothetical protein